MNRPRKRVLLFGLSLILAMTMLRGADPWPIAGLRMSYFDFLQRLDPRPPADTPVRIVDVDEDSLAAIGQWPWPRSVLADLVDQLNAQGAAVVAFDALFAEPDRYSPANLLSQPGVAELLPRDIDRADFSRFDTDTRLAEASTTMPTVFGIAATTSSSPALQYDKAGFVQIGQAPADGLIALSSTTPLLPELQAAASGIGNINVDPLSEGGVIRRVPLLWRTPTGPLPSLSIEALRVALGVSTVLVNGSPDIEAVTESLQIGEFEVPTTDDGQFWVRFRHDDPAFYVSAKDVLENPEKSRPLVEGQIVFVGTSAAGLLDIRTTALGENVPGVSIHAQIVEQILLGDFLHRSDFVGGLEILAFLALGLIVTIVMSRFGAFTSLAAGAISAMSVLAGSFLLFSRNGILFDASFPVLGGAVNFGALTAYQFLVADREKRAIRKSFTHYVSPDVLNEIEKEGYKLKLGGETRMLTILFCDIRNFTTLSETMEPNDIVTMLNTLFDRLSDAILEQKGTIDKFIGDSVMAFWNAPLALEDHPRRACLAALAMRNSLKAFNETPFMAQRPKIDIAVGCASGLACVGNVGSARQFNYSVVGDTVNVASRVESSCRELGYPIVIPGETGEAAADLAILPAGRIALKGRVETLDVHILVGDAELARSSRFGDLSKAHRALLDVLESASPGSPPSLQAESAMKLCTDLCVDLDPALLEFYNRIPDRIADFRYAKPA
ncbi:adenylate/guanylate cyclase domain-containing protein [Oricola sp.]|uniref:CHASE2 domain-containing protein n=1 Tax=Oricola sp. TaxID=1979950 RepID=UPI0025EEE2F0|nr:adenylate/guanylate cyclase domain-containing protein [Oricola sp.]MCI5077200.1 adenylate/guanylate cyclase domain-containing protein [Oricola sp.]